MPKKLWLLIALVFLLLGLAYFNFTRKTTNNIVIASIVEIQPIVELRRGFENQIRSSEWAKRNGVNFTYENANGQNSLVVQISDKLASSNATMIYVLGTPLAQAIQRKAPSILLVQGAATDPVQAGLARSRSGSGRNYVASTDLPPVKSQLELFQGMFPRAFRLGVLYNPSESNSAAVLNEVKAVVAESYKNLEIIELPISSSNDIALTLDAALGRIDALYLPPDNTAYAAVAVIGQKMLEAHKPLIACERSVMAHGAIIAVSLSYQELGAEAARLALMVVAGGAKAGEIPIEPAKGAKLVISQGVAQSFNVKVPDRPDVEIVK